MILYKLFSAHQLYTSIIGIFFIFALHTSYITAHEWLYPVAGIDEDHMYIIHQTSLHHIELWKWNRHTKYATKALLSTFIPAGLTMLPSGLGFSFIDRDMIRVKYDIKRSSKTIPLDAPLYNFTRIYWIDDTHAYLSAQERDLFGIYQIDIDGRVWSLVGDDEHDYMYPQKVGDRLWYVVRDSARYTIASVEYPHLELYGPEYEYSKIPHADPATVVELYSTTTPLVFLQMIDEHEGYSIQHPSYIDPHQNSIEFCLMRFYETPQESTEQERWQTDICFEFSIPTALLLGYDRLYESMLPFLPLIHNNTIYFVSYDSIQNSMNLCSYNIALGTVMVHAQSTDGFICSPYIIQNSLYYGGSLKESDIIGMYIDNGGLKIDLPQLTL